MIEKKIIVFKPTYGEKILLTVTLDDTEFDENDGVKIEVEYGSKNYVQTASDFFEALQLLRLELELDGMQIICNGATENVYPSPMIASMGEGRKAYRLFLGKQAKMEDIVDIFEYDGNAICVSVERQREFYVRWLKSIERR